MITESLMEDLVIPDEVLMEILLRLPLLSLQLFKSVSKHWLSLITSEYFIRRLRKPRIETPCGLFISKYNFEYYDFVTLGPKVTSFPLRATIAEAGSCFRILQSCNGLLLCLNVVSPWVYYYVYNPLTNIFKNIPFPRYQRSTDMILAFDPTKSPYYKLVITQKKNNLHNRNWEQDWVEDREQDWVEDREQDWEEDREQDWEEDSDEDSEEGSDEDSDTERILIYSSETGKWSICGPALHKGRFWHLSNGIYWNNAIHWINNYDGERLHYKFDIVDHPIVTNIQTPALDDVKDMSLFESCGSLLLLMEENDRCYHIFEMREESSEWSVKYIVDDIVNTIPYLYRWSHTYVLCIVLGERGDDSYMVIESDNKIVRYNFVSKSVSTLSTSYHYWGCIPFIASLAGV